MINRIHILGASGSGTTTLAEKLSKKMNYTHFDTDNYFWLDTETFSQKRKVEDRIELLSKEFRSVDKWILSGSLCGWGDVFIPLFDLVVFLWIPQEIRMERLNHREQQRYGDKINIGGCLNASYLEFMDWASKYDLGDMNIRSKQLHYAWMDSLPCPVLKIEEDINIEDKIKRVENIIKASMQ